MLRRNLWLSVAPGRNEITWLHLYKSKFSRSKAYYSDGDAHDTLPPAVTPAPSDFHRPTTVVLFRCTGAGFATPLGLFASLLDSLAIVS